MNIDYLINTTETRLEDVKILKNYDNYDTVLHSGI